MEEDVDPGSFDSIDEHIMYFETSLITMKLTSGGRQPLSQKILEDHIVNLKKRKAEKEQREQDDQDQAPDVAG